MERKLLNLFWGEKRPVPFDFYGYISPENSSWLPLKIILSNEYKSSSVDNQLKSFPKIVDREALDLLQNLGTENE